VSTAIPPSEVETVRCQHGCRPVTLLPACRTQQKHNTLLTVTTIVRDISGVTQTAGGLTAN